MILVVQIGKTTIDQHFHTGCIVMKRHEAKLLEIEMKYCFLAGSSRLCAPWSMSPALRA